jgi:hypothetical protein
VDAGRAREGGPGVMVVIGSRGSCRKRRASHCSDRHCGNERLPSPPRRWALCPHPLKILRGRCRRRTWNWAEV